jgi:zinc/manganese transport system substrate-binding protein
VWTDPLLMAEMVPALADQLGAALDADLSGRSDQLVSELEALHLEVSAIMEGVDECLLVTGHDSLGYFADRYGCEVVGAVIPGLSTTAEASAGQIAELRRLAEERAVPAIFTEIGTPERVAAQVAREVGVPLVELATHLLPDEGGFEGFLLLLASDIADAHG